MKIKLLIIASLFTTNIFAQNDCCQGLDNSFQLGCIDNLTPCNENTAPCNDATFDMLFYAADWNFFACGPSCPDPATCNNNWVDNNASTPVELASFFTQYDDSGIKLVWSTASEVNNDGFFIEMSRNGQQWDKIGFVEGNGNSSEEIEYSYLLDNPYLGANYFRLKQVDFDGAFEYSSVRISIWQGQENNLKLAVIPNPTMDFLVPLLPTEYYENETVNYHVRSINGMLIKAFENESIYDAKLDVSDLPTGSYLLMVDSKGLRQSTLFSKY